MVWVCFGDGMGVIFPPSMQPAERICTPTQAHTHAPRISRRRGRRRRRLRRWRRGAPRPSRPPTRPPACCVSESTNHSCDGGGNFVSHDDNGLGMTPSLQPNRIGRREIHDRTEPEPERTCGPPRARGGRKGGCRRPRGPAPRAAAPGRRRRSSCPRAPVFGVFCVGISIGLYQSHMDTSLSHTIQTDSRIDSPQPKNSHLHLRALRPYLVEHERLGRRGHDHAHGQAQHPPAQRGAVPGVPACGVGSCRGMCEGGGGLEGMNQSVAGSKRRTPTGPDCVSPAVPRACLPLQ